MSNLRHVIFVALVGLAVSGAACSQAAADGATGRDATNSGAATTNDKTENASAATAETSKSLTDRAVDGTKEIAGATAGKTEDIAGDIASKTKEITATTGEVITDGWITTKISTKFVDETLLKGSNINVDTDNHVVTLKGRVATTPARSRAEAIAIGTEGVTRVINQIVVK